jgi:hypothetical protein
MSVRFVSAALTVVALAAAPALLSAEEKAAPSKDGKAVQSATVEKAPSRQFAALKGVKVTPMSARELADVKGQHVHFWNPGAPFPTDPPHLAGDVKTENNWQDLYGQGDVANSYHGLCKAATNGSAIFINPGGGCGF